MRKEGPIACVMVNTSLPFCQKAVCKHECSDNWICQIPLESHVIVLLSTLSQQYKAYGLFDAERDASITGETMHGLRMTWALKLTYGLVAEQSILEKKRSPVWSPITSPSGTQEWDPLVRRLNPTSQVPTRETRGASCATSSASSLRTLSDAPSADLVPFAVSFLLPSPAKKRRCWWVAFRGDGSLPWCDPLALVAALPPPLLRNSLPSILRKICCTLRELIRSHNWTLKPQITGNIPLLRSLMTMGQQELSSAQESSVASHETSQPQCIKFKRLDKTAKHIMNILDNEAVDKVQTEREIPDIRPGYIVELKVEVPENKRQTSIIKGIIIARRNAGLNTTFRLRRLAAGVGVESVFPLYSPNIKEMKVVDKKKVRRAKLYYLRDRMNPLKK
ncbi:uncharacterized protein LOC103982565 [Musa acuminata AAA Group]|uniref:uncharacterized protein LOC103982565 n=1 Tax=Musa acuminata AAA Group TaxID=214697 RepID=UPI0031E4538E